MLKLLSLKSIYRQSRSESPTGVDFNFESFTHAEELKGKLNHFFNLEFTDQDYQIVHKQTQLETIDFFSEFNTHHITDDLELFLHIIETLKKSEKIYLIHESNKLTEYLNNLGFDKKKIKKLINIQNSRWMNLKSYIFNKNLLNEDCLLKLQKSLYFLKNKFTHDSNNNEFENSFSLYYFLNNNRVLKKLDFIGTQTLVTYEDEGLNVSLSGESQVIRSLVKQVFPGLMTRPSNSLFNNLNLIFDKLINEIEDFENISHERLQSIREFVVSSKLIMDKEVKKDVFKQNFVNKFDSYNLEKLGLRPSKTILSMSKEDIESYLSFNTLSLITISDFKESLIKIFQGLLVGKMWCAEKSIMHNLAKDNKFIDLDKVNAYVLNKYIDPAANPKKSKIKVCNHCMLMASFLNFNRGVAPSTPKRLKPYNSTPKTSPSTYLDRCLTEKNRNNNLADISKNLMLDFSHI